MSCSQCNSPCIRVGGKCIIAMVRKEFNISFEAAREAITKMQYPNQVLFTTKEAEAVDNFLNKQHKLIKRHNHKNQAWLSSKIK